GDKGDKGDKGEKGDKGDPGSSGDPTLTHICCINWKHAKPIPQPALERGLLIGFDQEVVPSDLTEQTVRVFREQSPMPNTRDRCWCQGRGRVEPGYLKPACKPDGEFNAGATPVNAAHFAPAVSLGPGRYRVVVLGDFIQDMATGRAVDA